MLSFLPHTLNLKGNWHFSSVLVKFSSSLITSQFFSTLSQKVRMSWVRKYDRLTIDIVSPNGDDHINIMVIWNTHWKKCIHSFIDPYFEDSVIMMRTQIRTGQTLPRIHKHELNIISAAPATVIHVLVNLFIIKPQSKSKSQVPIPQFE